MDFDANAIAAWVSAGTLLFGIFTWRSQDADRRRDAILEQARRSLESAYRTLTNDGATIPPSRDRLNWLTAARHIMRYKTLRSKLSDVQSLVCDEQEEYWRHKFYVALRPIVMDYDYFRQGMDIENQASVIELTSAVIVAKFSYWRAGAHDPVKDVSLTSFFEDDSSLHHYYAALRLHVEKNLTE